MSSTFAAVSNGSQRLPRSRSSSVTESPSPESTSSDSHSSSDPDTSLSPWLQTPSATLNKPAFSMDVDVASSMMDMDADMAFEGGMHDMQAMNAFQGYNVNLDDIVLSDVPTHMGPNTKADMLMLEEIIKDGAFDPASTSVAPFQSYPTRSPSFRDLIIPPHSSVHHQHPEPQPDSVCIDPSSTQSHSQPTFPSASQLSTSAPTFKTEPPGVLLLSPNSRTTDDTLIKHEPAAPCYSPLLPYDAELSALLSPEVVHPPKEACIDLPIFFPSIPAAGAKSRVETQIKLAFELGYPISPFSSSSSAHSPRPRRVSAISSPQPSSSSSSVSNSRSASPALEAGDVTTSNATAPQRPTHDKVGTYRFLRLPCGTATKRKPSSVGVRREPKPCDVQSEETLEMTADVVCCSSPQTPVYSCASCQSREAKRTARKLAARVRPLLSARSKPKSKGSTKKSGKKAKEQEYFETLEDQLGEDEEPNADGSILQFNCAEIMDFSGGTVVLPMRITCYCRHHKEKVGFNIVFTLRDHMGRVVGRGTTPPILITDDHKSTNAVSKLPPMHPLRQALNPHAPLPATPAPSNSTDEPKPERVQDQVPEQSPGRAPANRRDTDGVGKKRRPKPYDGRPTNRVMGVGPGIEGRQGVVLALHPAHTKAQVGIDSGQLATSANVMSPGGEPSEAVGSPASYVISSPATRSSSSSRPEASLPSPPHSHSGMFVPHGDMIMSALDTGRAFSHPPSPRGTGSSFLPTAPPSPSSLSSPSPSQVDHQTRQPVLHTLPDLHSFSQEHQAFLDTSSFPLYPSVAFSPSPPTLPRIQRLIPSSGPTTGGIEITVLGAGFNTSLPLDCVFGGAVASSTHRWSDNTLVCLLPPRATPGLVSVGFKDIKNEDGQDESMGCLFNYVDESDRQLMELALQVVGLKMTGKIEEARNVAMRIVGNTNTPTPTMTAGELSQMNSLSGAPFVHHSFFGSLSGMDLEALIIKLLTLLDVPTEGRPEPLPSLSRAISHHNATGQTLLHLAVLLALPALVSCLAERSIDLDARNNNGLTPLHFAALTGWKEGTEILLAAGADAGGADRMGLTADQRARDGRFEELEALFEELAEPEGESGEDGDDEAWHSGDDVSEEGSSEPEPSPSWPTVPPQYTPRSRMASPSHRDSSPEELSEPEQTPKISVAQPGTTTPEGPARRALVADKPVLNEKQDASFVERLQRTLPQGILPNVQIPGLPQLQLPDMLAAPWGALPQIPVFPVFVPIPNLPHLPNWPAFPWPDALSGEKKEGRAGDANGEQQQQQPPLAMLWTAYDSLANNAWRAQWEKWTAQLTALQNANTPGAELPPMYTPRSGDQQPQRETKIPNSPGEEPDKHARNDPATEDTPAASTSRPPVPKAMRRMGYSAVKVPETEVESYHYRPKTKAIQKKDRMLILFWIPILFIGLAYALYTTLPVAVAGLSRATKRVLPQLPQRDEIHV